MLIGVVSDTHWKWARPVTPAIELLRERKPDMILHAGDILDTELLDELAEIAPVHAVAGNNDEPFFSRLPYKLIVEAGDIRIGLVHGNGSYRTPDVAYATFLKDDVQVIVFGHSHVPYCEMREGRLMFNPGACSRPRSESGKPSFGLLHIDEEGKVTGEIVYFDK